MQLCAISGKSPFDPRLGVFNPGGALPFVFENFAGLSVYADFMDDPAAATVQCCYGPVIR